MLELTVSTTPMVPILQASVVREAREVAQYPSPDPDEPESKLVYERDRIHSYL